MSNSPWCGPGVTGDPFAAANHAAELLQADLQIDRIDVAVVCGSGLGAFAASVDNAREAPMGGAYGFAEPSVAGHAGRIVAGTVGENRVLVYAGRTHLYEGHHVHRCVHNVRVAAALGAKVVVLTNAAGAATNALHVGQLVAIGDHINLTGTNPLEGPLPEARGRFVDMTCPYSIRLNQIAHRIGWDMWEDPMDFHTYAAFRGPSYETRAEVRMACKLGADLVGMSTVCETIAARHCSLEVAAFSLVTNMAAGVSPGPLSHDEVTRIGAERSGETATFLHRFTAAITHPET